MTANPELIKNEKHVLQSEKQRSQGTGQRFLVEETPYLGDLGIFLLLVPRVTMHVAVSPETKTLTPHIDTELRSF